jgi:ribosomal protein L22
MVEDYKVHDGKKPEKDEEDKAGTKPVENPKEAKKTEEKKTEKKPEKSNKPKKNEAVVNGVNLSMGIKHAVAICNYIRGKDIDTSIKMLEEVEKYKKAIPMRGEIPHRHGMMSGRYPIKATGIMIKLLKSLKSNAIQNELELEKFKIFAMPNVSARPYKKFGRGRFKRAHVTLKLIPIHKDNKKEKKK